MAISQNQSFNPPYNDSLIDRVGAVSSTWQRWYRSVRDALTYLGLEYSYPITDNQATPESIENLAFDFRYTSQATIEYCIQRVATNKLIETGVFYAVYRPDANDWKLFVPFTPGPDTSGVTFSITTGGVVQYVSTNEAGTPTLSRIFFRVRTLSGKSNLYSQMGN